MCNLEEKLYLTWSLIEKGEKLCKVIDTLKKYTF